MKIEHTEMFHVYGHLINNINMMLEGQRQNYPAMYDEEVLADLIGMLLMAYGTDIAENVIMNLIYRFDMNSEEE